MLLEYSLVSIRFAGRVSAIPVPHEEALDARRMAHRFLNHFLDLYRFTAKDSATLPLTWGEFHEVRAGRALLCAMAPDDPEALSRAAGGEPIMQASFGVAFRDEDPIVHHFGPRRLIEEDVEAGLRKNLLEGVKPDLPALLLLNAAHHRAASDFRLAVIDASAALDIVVETLARRILVKRGLTLEAAEGKLERLTTLPTVREVIVGSTDMDVESDADWQAWETQHRHLRNKVVHDGHQPGESEAVDMLGSIDRLIGRFERASAV
jgi:hypothetical protein